LTCLPLQNPQEVRSDRAHETRAHDVIWLSDDDDDEMMMHESNKFKQSHGREEMADDVTTLIIIIKPASFN
jgi:hypothetical protein